MYYAGIKNCDVANGPGFRVTLFVSGCRNRCPGCFQPETWSFTYGQEFMLDTLIELDNMLNNPTISGLSILGGDPFESENVDTVAGICRHVKEKYPEKSIWVWTGYSLDDVWEEKALKYIDVLVDGKFEQDKKDLTLKWRGSSNQRIIDIRKTFETGNVILLEDCDEKNQILI